MEIIKESNKKLVNNPNNYIIEGIRSPAEVKIFRKNFRYFKVIAVHSSPKTRFMRLKKRKRSDDSPNFHEFNKRDKRELNFGIGDVIATSNYMVVNEGPIWKFKNAIRNTLRNEMEKKTSSKSRKP